MNPLIKFTEEFYQNALETMIKKNSDYATEKDPFLNFRASEMVGVDPKRAILVRMTDKLTRLSNNLEQDLAVKDETLYDTAQDLVNYTAILTAMLFNGEKRGDMYPEARNFANEAWLDGGDREK